MLAAIIRAVGVFFWKERDKQYHPRRRRAGCLSVIRAEGVHGGLMTNDLAGYRGGAMRASLWRRYWK